MRSKYLLFLALFLPCLMACNDDDSSITAGDELTLSASVTTTFVAADGVHETVDFSYFEDGDEIGVFALQANGTIPDDCCNIQCTYDADDEEWDCDDDVCVYTGATYFAYYPYNDDLDTDEVSSISDVITLLTDTLVCDQSTYSQFLTADFLVASGAVADEDDLTLSFKFSHAVSLVGITLPTMECVTTDATPFQYTALPCDVTFTCSIDGEESEISPYYYDGVYYTLLPPSTAFDIDCSFLSVNGVTTSYTYSSTGITGGNYRHATVSSTTSATYERDFALGDYYYSDGSICPGTINGSTHTTPPEDGCVGIIFMTSLNNADRIASAENASVDGGTAHAIVLATQVATTSAQWGAAYKDEGLTLCSTFADCYNDNSGLANSQYIWDTYDDTTLEIIYPAFHYAKTYNDSIPVPSTTSGWFLPSAGQWWDAFEVIGDLSSTMSGDRTSTESLLSWEGVASTFVSNANSWLDVLVGDNAADTMVLGSYYWTSSQYSDNYARYMYISNSSGSLGFPYDRKSSTRQVRCMLAF